MTNLDRFARVVRTLNAETRTAVETCELNGLIAGIVEGLAVAIITRGEACDRQVADLVDMTCHQITEVAAEMMVSLRNGTDAVPPSMRVRYERIQEGH